MDVHFCSTHKYQAYSLTGFGSTSFLIFTKLCEKLSWNRKHPTDVMQLQNAWKMLEWNKLKYLWFASKYSLQSPIRH